MSQCQFTSEKTPVCRARAVKGADFCAFHRVRTGRTGGLDLTADPAPPLEDAPRIDPDRLLAGQRKRAEERRTQRQSTAAMPMAGEHIYEPEVIGARVAVMLHQAEIESRADYRDRGRPRRDEEGYRLDDGDPEASRRPLKVLTRRTRPDPTRIIDPITKQAPKSLRSDFVHRWVSVADWNDRPTESRVAEYEDYGYEFVVDEEGRPIEGRYGVAMQAPPENYAARMLDRTPTGAFQRDDSLMHADSIADTISSRVGHEAAVRVIAERDHGKKVSEVPLGQERLHDV